MAWSGTDPTTAWYGRTLAPSFIQQLRTHWLREHQSPPSSGMIRKLSSQPHNTAVILTEFSSVTPIFMTVGGLAPPLGWSGTGGVKPVSMYCGYSYSPGGTIALNWWYIPFQEWLPSWIWCGRLLWSFVAVSLENQYYKKLTLTFKC